jgi:Icc-related predicted phosphoesterase
LRSALGKDYPQVFMIPGNDDARSNEPEFLNAEVEGLWTYMHLKHCRWKEFDVAGCAYVPPTPFRLKDWERYDVSRYADPGCIHPMDGEFSVPPKDDTEFVTIASVLQDLLDGVSMEHCILLMHTPPYHSKLDRAGLDGMSIDHVPLDVHVGSIALQRFIETQQPYLTLHGHIHESSQITGAWIQHFGRTVSMNAAYKADELSLLVFDLREPEKAIRYLL